MTTTEKPLRVVAVLEHRGDGVTALVRRTAEPGLVAAVEALLDDGELPPDARALSLEEPLPAA